MGALNKKIQILLSTYNGERYLREQLDSFISQENFSEIKVLIRDDGSTDSTLKILSEYENKYGFEIIRGENLGLNASMQMLVEARDRGCDFFAFSDQDDVWFNGKVKRGVTLLSEKDDGRPALYVSTSTITDSELNPKGHTFIPKKPLTFYNAMIQNVCPGHAQICNAALADILEKNFSHDMMVYDYWTYLLASATGNVYFDKTETAYYRQHENNAIGYGTSRFKVLKARIARIKTRKSILNAKQLYALCEVAHDIIPREYLKESESFFKCQRSFFTRLKYFFISKAYRQTKTETLIFKFMYLFGRYNITQNK
jgi:glycosyltransferase involved in cell wall biosynthesis